MELRPLHVRASDDRVLFAKGAGSECKIYSEDRLIVRQRDIVGALDASERRKPQPEL